jgi:hypothetical protein
MSKNSGRLTALGASAMSASTRSRHSAVFRVHAAQKKTARVGR